MSGLSERYHAFDLLRGVMMLLGIWLHASLNYTAAPLGDRFPMKDAATSTLFDAMTLLLITCRVPVFLVLSGFFGAMILEKRGLRGFTSDRLRKVAAPLAVFWLPVYLATAMLFGLYFNQFDWYAAGAQIMAGKAFDPPRLIHFWFLYYLLWFYAVVWIGVKIRFGNLLEAVKLHAFLVHLLFPLASFFLLFGTEQRFMERPLYFPPELRKLLTFGVFFAYGWWLFLHQSVLQMLEKQWIVLLLGGAVAFAVYGNLVMADSLRGSPPGGLLCLHIACVIATWLLIWGLLGWFLRRFGRPSATGTFLSRASYWCYLTHLPVVVLFQILLLPAPLPAVLKWLIVVSVTTSILLAAYRWWARDGWVGRVLSGRF